MKAVNIYDMCFILVQLVFFVYLVETNQVQNKQSYLPQDVASNLTVVEKRFYNGDDSIMSSSLQGKHHRKLGYQVPKCRYQNLPR